MGVSQHEARLIGQLFDQRRSYLVVCHVGRGEPSREWNPHPGHGDGQVQLPPIDPPVPATLGPSCFCVYGSVRDHSGFLVLLVPHPAFGSKRCAVQGDRSSCPLPWSKQPHQMTSQAADLLGKRSGQGFEPPLEGAPCGKASLLTEEFAHHPHLWCGFVEDCQELSPENGLPSPARRMRSLAPGILLSTKPLKQAAMNRR